MNLNRISQFAVEDFIKAGPWVPKLFQLLNDWLSSSKSVLNKGITITDNCNAEIREISFKTKASVDDTWPVKSKLNIGKPRQVMVGAAYAGTGVNEKPVVAPNIAWTYDGGQLVITGAAGLSPSTDYKLVVTVWVN